VIRTLYIALSSNTYATLTIFIRSSFCVAELSGGIYGPLANNYISFMTLEGAVIVTASLCLTILHPGVCFMGAWSESHFMLCFKIGVEEKAVSVSFDGETAASIQGILV
jgi:hypothetical protein